MSKLEGKKLLKYIEDVREDLFLISVQIEDLASKNNLRIIGIKPHELVERISDSILRDNYQFIDEFPIFYWPKKFKSSNNQKQFKEQFLILVKKQLIPIIKDIKRKVPNFDRKIFETLLKVNVKQAKMICIDEKYSNNQNTRKQPLVHLEGDYFEEINKLNEISERLLNVEEAL